MRTTCFVTLFALILAAGCAPHRPIDVQPPGKLPETFSSQPARVSGEILSSKWWGALNDPGLNTMMEHVLVQNLDLAQAFARLKQSRALAAQSGAAQWPSLDVKGFGGKQRQITSLGPVTDETYGLSAAAAFEIDIWKKLSSRARAAVLDVRASEQELKSVYVTLTAQVADLYFLALEQQAQVDLTQQTIGSFRDTLKRVERRYRLGLVPALDVYQSRQNLAAAEARLPRFKAALAATLHHLAVLSGEYPTAHTMEKEVLLPDVPSLYPQVLPASLLMHRPDIQSALNKVRAADARVAAAVADRFPSFSLTGTYGGRSNELEEVLKSSNIFWTLLVNVTMPIIDGGRRRAEVRRTEAVVMERLAAYHQSVLNGFRDVEDSLADIQANTRRVELLQDRAEAAESSLRLSTERYLKGLSDYLPVLTAQNSHFTAQSEYLTAKRQVLSDYISLIRALGGTWMEQEIANRENIVQNTRPKK